jgi:hypothetical protein
VEIWAGEIEDHVGGLTTCLEPLGDAGADLQVVIARRRPDVPGKGVVFVGPVSGKKARQAAEVAGLHKAGDLVALHVEGANKPGECRRLTGVLAEAGINLSGLSALAIGAWRPWLSITPRMPTRPRASFEQSALSTNRPAQEC